MRLSEIASKTNLMEISISYGTERFNFNLYQELVVNERNINHELMVQPTSYAFLSLLHKKLYRKQKDMEQELNKIYAKLYIRFKEESQVEVYRVNKDYIDQKVIKHKDYQAALSAYNSAESDCKIIETCVRSFEQRKDLIQTLSANIRKEV